MWLPCLPTQPRWLPTQSLSSVGDGKITRIRAVIFVTRKSQLSILIGHSGKALKMVGTEARKDIERFLGKKVFLEMVVKVDEDWRDNDKRLRKYGYIE